MNWRGLAPRQTRQPWDFWQYRHGRKPADQTPPIPCDVRGCRREATWTRALRLTSGWHEQFVCYTHKENADDSTYQAAYQTTAH